MTIPDLQIKPLGASFQKKLPQNWLWPNIGKFIVDFHWINILDAILRFALALDTPNLCSTLNLGRGDDATMVSNDYVKRTSPSSNTM